MTAEQQGCPQDLRTAILEVDDLESEYVEVPEWGFGVYVRMMTGAERDQYESELMQKQDLPLSERMKGVRAKLAALCIVDANGANPFSPDDVRLLEQKNSQALERIVAVASRLNALMPEDIEDIAGN